MFLDLYNNRNSTQLKTLVVGTCFYFHGEPTLYMVCGLEDNLTLRDDNSISDFDTCLILDLTSSIVSECVVTKIVVPIKLKCVRVEGEY